MLRFAVAIAMAFAGFGGSAAGQGGLADIRASQYGADFPYESRFAQVLGSRMHYIDEGPADGQVFLFLHGNPTSSYLWRNVIGHVAPHGRAIAVDNIGFGKSDKPDIGYTLQDHAAYLEGFIEALGLTDIIFVVHDWGSGLGLDWAARHPDAVKGMVMMEAIIPPAFPDPNPAGGLFASFRTDGPGQELIMEQNVFIEQLLGNATLTRDMPEAVMDEYRAPFPTAESRYPIYVWPNELPMGGAPARNVEAVENYGQWLHASQTPKLLLYARPGAIIGADEVAYAAENFPNIELQFVGYGSHYIQEDNPEAIGRAIAEWARRNFD